MITDFDVIVVGSGAGGGMAALRLCEAGFKVALIERGPRFDPSKDYIFNQRDWDLWRDPLEAARQEEQSIARNPSADGERGLLDYHRVHGVGGSTLHYQGEAHRFPEHSFAMHSRFGWAADWPISYTDLAPYYEQAEALLGVAGEPGNPFKAERGPFPCPAHPLSAKSLALQKAATAAGFTLQANTLALPTQAQGDRPPCQRSGTCNFGCIFRAKSSIDQAIIPRAEATGNLTLFIDTRVNRLELAEDGQINGVACSSAGQHTVHRARRYVLAGGAVETPRLMLLSQSQHHPHGFANAHDQVGRYFMDTLVARMALRLEPPMPAYEGPPLDARVWDFALPKDSSTAGFVLGVAGYLYRGTGPVRHATQTPGLGRAHKARVRETFGTEMRLFGIAEQEPQTDNRVTLANEVDEDGIAKVHVRSELSTRDKHTLEVMKEKLAAWATAAKPRKSGRLTTTAYRTSATHVGGSCRMGNAVTHSVVDAVGKVHGSSNCYIADASVLPTQGAGDSPSLTIQALALRTADALAAELKAELT